MKIHTLGWLLCDAQFHRCLTTPTTVQVTTYYCGGRGGRGGHGGRGGQGGRGGRGDYGGHSYRGNFY